jgi:hypothetical protein
MCIYTKYTHTYNGVLFRHKEDETTRSEGKWMQLEDIMLSEVSQAQKNKGCLFSLRRGRRNTCLSPTSERKGRPIKEEKGKSRRLRR